MRIVVGVGGGIAAYKACEVVSRLVQAHHTVQVLMTHAAAEFVTPLTFAALSGREVGVAASDRPMGPISHVALAGWAEAMVIVPATADLLARMAVGHATDLLVLTYLGFRGPKLAAPAMEPEMWSHPAVRRHVATLEADGVTWVGPASGRTASGQMGIGRMAEASEVVQALDDALTVKDWASRRVLVTAGPTWEYFDPVRLLSNPSTGTMGALLALQAAMRGATVELVHGPRVAAPVHARVRSWPVTSAEEMLQVCVSLSAAVDVVIGAAAVSDFRPRQRLVHKSHKEQVGREWQMEPTPDVLGELSQILKPEVVRVGFAAESEQLMASATRKLRNKGLDFIVGNPVGPHSGFGDLAYEGVLIARDGRVVPLPGTGKADAAKAILDEVGKSMGAMSPSSDATSL